MYISPSPDIDMMPVNRTPARPHARTHVGHEEDAALEGLPLHADDLEGALGRLEQQERAQGRKDGRLVQGAGDDEVLEEAHEDGHHLVELPGVVELGVLDRGAEPVEEAHGDDRARQQPHQRGGRGGGGHVPVQRRLLRQQVRGLVQARAERLGLPAVDGPVQQRGGGHRQEAGRGVAALRGVEAGLRVEERADEELQQLCMVE